MTDKVKAAIVLFLSSLDEQQRRIYAGLEALKAGRGGDHWIAEMLEHRFSQSPNSHNF